MHGPTATERYNAERNRLDMSGERDLVGPTNPIVRLPEADADAVSPLFNLCACQRWLTENGRKERERAFLLAQRLAAIEAEVDDFMEDVGYVAGPAPTYDYDDETDWKEERW